MTPTTAGEESDEVLTGNTAQNSQQESRYKGIPRCHGLFSSSINPKWNSGHLHWEAADGKFRFCPLAHTTPTKHGPWFLCDPYFQGCYHALVCSLSGFISFSHRSIQLTGMEAIGDSENKALLASGLKSLTRDRLP